MFELDGVIEELTGEHVRGNAINAMLLCPFHDEDSPSFSIHRQEGLWHCFGCGLSGNIERLARMMGEPLSESVRHDILIRSLDNGETAERRRNFAPLANGYIDTLAHGYGEQIVNAYLAERRLPLSVAYDFGIGFNEPRGCISFPYWDDESVTGIKYRTPDGFKFAEDGSNFGLYNVNDIRGRSEAFIFEGESDTHQGWRLLSGTTERGIGVGGTSGAVKSERLWQLFAVDLLFARKVYLCYDNDKAGDEAAEVAKKVLGDKVIRLRPTRGNDFTEHILAGGTLEELMAAGTN